MKRRQFLTTTAALALTVPTANSIAAGGHTQAYAGYADYQQALADGKPFMLDFYASW